MKQLAAAACAALAAATAAAPATRAAPPRPVRASLDLSAPRPPVPASFLGLSFETKALPQVAHYGDEGNMVGLMRSLGPGVLRFGGVTVDTQTQWSRDGAISGSWANTAITPDDLAGIDRLLSEAGWSVVLGVNLGHYDPSAAADEVASARAQLATRLAGVEIGNEPDGYPIMHLRADSYAWPDYKAQLDSYLQAIGQAFPLAGPGVSTPHKADWIRDEAAQERPTMLTGHYYPLSYCHGYLPVVDDLMSSHIRKAQKSVLDRMAAISTTTGLPLRLGETNNISCGGEPGVSNTFGAALWAVDYIAQAMSEGLAGINFHDIISNCGGYGALCAASSDDLAAGRLTAQPEWYALLLTRALLGSQPVDLHIKPRTATLSATAFRTRSGKLQLVLVNEGARPVRVEVPVGQKRASATVLRLTAPAPDAASGVRLGGAAVAADGSFRPRRLQRVVATAKKLRVVVGPASAALVTVSVRSPAGSPFGL